MQSYLQLKKTATNSARSNLLKSTGNELFRQNRCQQFKSVYQILKFFQVSESGAKRATADRGRSRLKDCGKFTRTPEI